MRNFAVAYGISVISSAGSSLVTGLCGSEVGHSIFRAPCGKFARLHAKLHRWILPRKGKIAYFRFGDRDAIRRVAGIQLQCIVPWRRGIHLPVGGHAAIAQFYPVFSNPVGEDERTAFNRNRVIEPA